MKSVTIEISDKLYKDMTTLKHLGVDINEIIESNLNHAIDLYKGDTQSFINVNPQKALFNDPTDKIIKECLVLGEKLIFGRKYMRILTANNNKLLTTPIEYIDIKEKETNECCVEL